MFWFLFLPLAFSNEKLKAALSLYNSSQFCETRMIRSYSSEILQTEKSSTSIFSHQKSKFKLEQIDKGKSVLLFDGTSFWVLEYDSPESPYPEQISRSNSKESLPKLKQLLDYEFLKRHFTISIQKGEGGVTVYRLLPNSKGKSLHIHDLKVGVKESKLVSVVYKDEVENRVNYEIKSTHCQSNAPSGFFKFEPKDKNTVIEL